MIKKLLIVVALLGTGMMPLAFGHGVGFEEIGPVTYGNKIVTLEVTSSGYEDPDSTDREIQFSFSDAETDITIRDVIYHITAIKGERELFAKEFAASNGIFVFVLEGTESDEIIFESEDKSSFFDTLTGLKKEIIRIKGAPFNTGGLYEFDVRVTTPGSFTNVPVEPIEFNVGLSIPERTTFEIDDPNFGIQPIDVITYYDEISDFSYDHASKEISFLMPFEWSKNNINETSVVHEELSVQKTFGDVLVSKYDVSVNGILMPERATNVDDFAGDSRIIHIVLNQNDLYDILENQTQKDNVMEFLLYPASDSKLSTATKNGQFRVGAEWAPKEIRSGSEIVFFVEITDIFLKDRPIAVQYELTLTHGDTTIASTRGTSSGEKGVLEEFRVDIPEDTSGPATLQFENLDGNKLARASLPIIIDRTGAVASIPEWIKNNAGWWATGEITDDDFVSGIEYLIGQGIISVPHSDQVQGTSGGTIPEWVKNNAGWWATGEITDDDFVSGIEYLIGQGIISV